MEPSTPDWHPELLRIRTDSGLAQAGVYLGAPQGSQVSSVDRRRGSSPRGRGIWGPWNANVSARA